MIGGAVNGGRMLGAYPDDLTDSGTLNIGRGRLIPTTAWEQLWQPLAQWFGVEDADMDEILPNLANFPEATRISKAELFQF